MYFQLQWCTLFPYMMAYVCHMCVGIVCFHSAAHNSHITKQTELFIFPGNKDKYLSENVNENNNAVTLY